jgi:hypothetical protein
MLLLSVFGGLLYSAAVWQEGWQRFLESGSLNWLDLVPVFGVSLALLPIVLLIYPMITSILFEATWGQGSADISLGQSSGRALSLSNLLVRAFSLPLSMLLFGWLSLPFSRRALHDYLARTRVLRNLTAS